MSIHDNDLFIIIDSKETTLAEGLSYILDRRNLNPNVMFRLVPVLFYNKSKGDVYLEGYVVESLVIK